MIWAVCPILLWAGIATVDRVRADPSRGGVPVDVPKAAVGGVMTLAAYLFILVAFSVAPLTAVAPLRESAIVLASGWGTLRLGEAAGAREAALRIAASAVVVLGAVLLALDG